MTAEEIHLTWAPPITFTLHVPPQPRPEPPNPQPDLAKTPQADEPQNEVPTPENVPIRAPPKESPNDWYNSERTAENDEYSTSDILSDTFRSKRDVRYPHRHRKRRQEVPSAVANETVEIAPKVKKAAAVIPHKGALQVAYVLYYEQGLPRSDSSVPVTGIPSSDDVKMMNVFPSDLGMEDYPKGAKNLTLLNAAGVMAKFVGFRLRNLSECLLLFPL